MEKLNIKEFLDQDEKKDLLRLLTAGSVDDGKSTLIGRLLFDSKKLYEDQLDALRQMCKDAAAGSDSIAKSQCDGDDRDIAHRHRFFGNKLDSADHDG